MRCRGGAGALGDVRPHRVLALLQCDFSEEARAPPPTAVPAQTRMFAVWQSQMCCSWSNRLGLQYLTCGAWPTGEARKQRKRSCKFIRVRRSCAMQLRDAVSSADPCTPPSQASAKAVQDALLSSRDAYS